MADGRILTRVIGPTFPAVLYAAQHGKDWAFDALYRDANPALVRYLRTLDAGAAEDIAAETWLSVVRGIARFSGDEPSWRSWLFTIARRRWVEETRRRVRRVLTTEYVPDEHANESETGADAADDALRNLDLRSALALVSTLPRLQSEVIVLRFVAGLDVAQVAQVVGRSAGSVRVASHRGLRTLSRLLTEQGVTQ